MSKYYKVEVEAIQWTGNNISEIAAFISPNVESYRTEVVDGTELKVVLKTSQRCCWFTVPLEDYVVKVGRRIFQCSSALFESSEKGSVPRVNYSTVEYNVSKTIFDCSVCDRRWSVDNFDFFDNYIIHCPYCGTVHGV